MIKQRDREEAKKLMDDYSRRELERERQWKNKYNNISNHIDNNMNNYAQQILKSNLKRQMTEKQKEENAIKEQKQKLDNDYLNQLAQRKAQQQEMNKTIQAQVNEKKNQGKLYNIESQLMKEKAKDIKDLDEQMKNERKRQQIEYKNMLNSQIQFNNKIKLQGNMTAVEKQLNKVDLKAYKNNDKNI
mgnify:CR=1 FL=1